LTADEPLTGQLANLVDDLIVRAATMASPVVAPDSPAAPGLIDALGRVAGRASDRGERAVIGWTITPVTEALQALHGLLKDPGWQASRHAPRIRAALRQQLTDPHPVNRMLAAQALQLIEPAGPSRLALARQRLLTEPDAHIRAVLVFQLMSLGAEHAAAVDGLVAELDSSGSWPFASTSPAHGATTADEQSAVENDDDTLANQELVQATVLLVLRLAIQHQQAAAIRIVHRWFTDPVDHADLVHAAVDQLRKLGVLVPDREDSTATGTAFALLSEATGQLATMIEAQRSGQERDDAVLRTALELADTVVDQLYFASGAFGERRTATSGPQEQAGSSSPTGTAFFDLAMPLLDQLAQIHHPRITHRLVETLAHLAEYDPKRVLLTVHRAVPPGEDYTYEPLAVGLIVRLVQRYLAENRELVTTDEDVLTALRELIEVFVRAGWPEAITLAYQLPNAFR
jgi:hypothetical protein